MICSLLFFHLAKGTHAAFCYVCLGVYLCMCDCGKRQSCWIFHFYMHLLVRMESSGDRGMKF